MTTVNAHSQGHHRETPSTISKPSNVDDDIGEDVDEDADEDADENGDEDGGQDADVDEDVGMSDLVETWGGQTVSHQEIIGVYILNTHQFIILQHSR